MLITIESAQHPRDTSLEDLAISLVLVLVENIGSSHAPKPPQTFFPVDHVSGITAGGIICKVSA